MGTNCSPTCSSLRVRFKEILMKNENNKNMIPTTAPSQKYSRKQDGGRQRV
jgi:hypothetical protein